MVHLAVHVSVNTYLDPSDAGNKCLGKHPTYDIFRCLRQHEWRLPEYKMSVDSTLQMPVFAQRERSSQRRNSENFESQKIAQYEMLRRRKYRPAPIFSRVFRSRRFLA